MREQTTYEAMKAVKGKDRSADLRMGNGFLGREEITQAKTRLNKVETSAQQKYLKIKSKPD